MTKSKGLIIGVAVAVVASVMLVGGFAVTSTQGAGTDFPVIGGGPTTLTPPDSTSGNTNPTTPPQSPVESPAIPGTDTTGGAANNGANPEGSVAGNNGAPGTIDALPNAGYGPGESNSSSSMILLLAAAGLALVCAGSTVVATGRRK